MRLHLSKKEIGKLLPWKKEADEEPKPEPPKPAASKKKTSKKKASKK